MFHKWDPPRQALLGHKLVSVPASIVSAHVLGLGPGQDLGVQEKRSRAK